MHTAVSNATLQSITAEGFFKTHLLVTVPQAIKTMPVRAHIFLQTQLLCRPDTQHCENLCGLLQLLVRVVT